ncbi:AglZ/HisF2 family acetamidino modification protein [Photorhabdus heterorhabditis]|uniref:AglZ/HisF2 family acetamidino modification protein n=1 Tax=Photorhabdus heterorhabditis TaxID=880156 RepID=UPI001BD5301B|nr:AglZ/HisF2 family acetamidino modification protein [Photorhabdus heterorhabditis]MBS9442724.1 imidazole glycerol phosphate synthase subunit HisF [Photorhabdus heterorhabditis]
MLRHRVIPVLLFNNDGLQKGRIFKNHRYIGDPINAVKIFNNKEVDELVLLDIEASVKNREINFDILKEIASEAFMPLSYGGGIKNIKDIEKIFSIGFEKIILNTSAVNNPKLIQEASSLFGSQSIVVSIDVKKNFIGKYIIYTKSGTQKCTLNFKEHIRNIENLGAGEIILTSINNEGTKKGFDTILIKEASHFTNIPIVISGGAGSFNHIRDAINSGAQASAIGTMFTFYGPNDGILLTYPNYKEINSLSS